MRIFYKDGEFDLPKNFVLEVEKKNPFFNTIGEKTLPVTLPLTSNNKRLIGINSLDNRLKPIYKNDVTIEEGVIRFPARQIIHNITSAGISCTFYLGLSKFWELINETKIRDLFEDVVYYSSNLQGDLIRSMNYSLDYDFVTFEALVKLSDDEYFRVNELMTEDDGSLSFVGKDARTIIENGISTKVPAGYGISTFIKINKLLKLIMTKLGYELKPNFLDSQPFNQIVLLNNVVDLIVTDKIKYAQLVPDITVQEVLDIFRARFNIEFDANENLKTIEIVPFNYSSLKSVDLSSYQVADLAFDFKEEFSKIALKITKNDEESNTEGSTINDVISKYEDIAYINEEQFSNWNILEKYDCVLRASTGDFYALQADENDITRLVRIGTINYDYDTIDTIEAEEIEMKDEAVALLHMYNKMLPYLGSAIYLNTALKDAANTESEIIFPIKLVFAKKYEEGNNMIGYASINEYDKDGFEDLTHSLALWGEKGTFAKFYLERDAMLRHSNYIVTTQLLLSTNFANNINALSKFLIDRQEYAADTIKYTLGQTSSLESTFRTLRLYEPYDLATEQKQVIFDPVSYDYIYYWLLQNNINEIIPPPDGIIDWEINILENIPTPVGRPTASQYESGGKYFLLTVKAELIQLVQGNPQFYSYVDVDTWYIPARK